MLLNVTKVGAALTWGGSEFHSEGAATANAPSPHVRLLDLWGWSWFAVLDRREREGAWRWMSSER